MLCNNSFSSFYKLLLFFGGVYGLTIIIVQIDSAIWVQISKKLFVFHIMLIPLGKAWIQLFSFQLGVNREDSMSYLTLVSQPIQEKENWIQISYRLEEGWALLAYYCPRHVT